MGKFPFMVIKRGRLYIVKKQEFWIDAKAKTWTLNN